MISIILIGLFIALAINVGISLIDKYSSIRLSGSFDVFCFSMYKTVLCALLSAVLLPFGDLYINIAGVVTAVFAGVFHAASVILIMQCLKCNKTVHVNLFMSAGVIIPVISGCFLWHQKIAPAEAICLLLLIASLGVVLNIRFNFNRGVRLLLLMFVCYGMLMVMQAMYPKCCDCGSMIVFSVIMYAVSAAILAVSVKRTGKSVRAFSGTLKLFLVSASVLNFLINLLLTSLSAHLDAIIVFPFVHGMKVVALMLISPVLWKERLNAVQIAGCLIAILCITVISV